MKKYLPGFLVLAVLASVSGKAYAGFNQDKYNNIVTVLPYTTMVSSSGVGPVISSVTFVTGEYNYITSLTIVAFSTGTATATATAATCVSSNLSGSPTYDFATAVTLGTVQSLNLQFANPLRATNRSDASYISCPATPGVRWNINLGYYRSN